MSERSTTAWVVIDVGCHECGVGHEVLGAYTTQEEAEQVAESRRRESGCWRGGGQSIAAVFEVDVAQVVDAWFLDFQAQENDE